MEFEEVVGAGEGEGNGSRCHTAHQQRQQAAEGEINHQHLQREHQPRNGCLEDAADSTRSATAHKEHHLLPVKMEHLPEVGTYGRTRQHDRSLSTDGTAETDGKAGCHDARPCVVSLYETLLAGYGIEYLCDAMADVVSHDIAHEEAGEEDTHDGIYQIQAVGTRDGELMCQQVLNLVDKPFQQQPRQCREHTYHQGQQQHELSVLDVLGTPQ